MTELCEGFPTAAQCVAMKWQRASELREQAVQFLNGPVRTELINSAHACTWISVPLPDALSPVEMTTFTEKCRVLLSKHSYKSVLLNGHSLELHWA